ncbi:hypothetical protein LHYA1_G001493 [Lachnellula hyalina]|uniref:F-box domain-containing protein n=1 Tax=Lachnellula hyalina TaxID=1316788 RepID=A0A8H8U3U5_9HELO|nr:uncharacterized protein LHYA1_G001493 [Lachnellula hyalina]TVY29532.1 hypothetical protein LHYA1_G001493 [Lachnellula hyalina]
MDELPTELRRAVFEQCDRETVRSLRRASKAWAKIGEEYLLPSTFTTYPYRNDTDRLDSISQYEGLAKQIQRLCLNHGEINEWHARHNTYFLNYMRNSEEVSEEMATAWHHYNSLKKLMELYHLNSCTIERLEPIFARLPNLQSVEISLMNCIFYQEDDPLVLKQIWSIPSTRRVPREATVDRFTNILLALQTNAVTHLSHDRIPFEFFAQSEDVLEKVIPVFQRLTSVKLSMDLIDRPIDTESNHSKAFKNLSRFLRSTTGLRALELDFHGRRKVDLEPLFSSLCRHDFVFEHLEELTLKEFTSTEFAIGEFLAKQKSLKTLHLGGAGDKPKHHPPCGGVWLDEGSFKGLFERVDREMELESFLMQGDLLGLESNESWELEEPVAWEDLGDAPADIRPMAGNTD